jgi:hypothetical protein
MLSSSLETEQGTPWREWGLRQAFSRGRKRAGVEPFRLHDLRHYRVTALFRRGVVAPTVQALAGHAHLTTTRRYAPSHAWTFGLRSSGSQTRRGNGRWSAFGRRWVRTALLAIPSFLQ